MLGFLFVVSVKAFLFLYCCSVFRMVVVLPGALADLLEGDCILCWLMKLLFHPKKKKVLKLEG